MLKTNVVKKKNILKKSYVWFLFSNSIITNKLILLKKFCYKMKSILNDFLSDMYKIQGVSKLMNKLTPMMIIAVKTNYVYTGNQGHNLFIYSNIQCASPQTKFSFTTLTIIMLFWRKKISHQINDLWNLMTSLEVCCPWHCIENLAQYCLNVNWGHFHYFLWWHHFTEIKVSPLKIPLQYFHYY